MMYGSSFSTFEKWLERINGHIPTGEAAYRRNDTTSLYDTIPALWKNLIVEERHDVIAIIDRFTENSQNGCNISTDKELIVSLSKFVNLNNVSKLHVCHQVAKHNPSVTVGLRINIDNINDEHNSMEEEEEVDKSTSQ